MATINGVDISIIISYNGKPLSSISVISGLQTSNIPDWPQPGIICEVTYYGYSDGILTSPFDSCTAEPTPYNLGSNGILYLESYCGDDLGVAPDGFYSSRGSIFIVNEGSLIPWKRCPSFPRFTDLLNVVNTSTPNFQNVAYQYTNQQTEVAGYYRFNKNGIFSSSVVMFLRNSLQEQIPPFDGETTETSPPNYPSPMFFQITAGSGGVNGVYVKEGEYLTFGFISTDYPPGNDSVVVTVEFSQDNTNWTNIGEFSLNVISQ